MKHVISVLVDNVPGVVSRISGLFSGRGFNIESFVGAPSLDSKISRIIIVTEGNEKIIEQIIKQLNKLIDVIKVTDLTGSEFVDREMILISVKAEENNRAEVLRIVDIFRGKIVDVSPNCYTIEITGDQGKLQAILDLLKPLRIQEIVRSGRIALPRAKKR